MCGLGLAAIVGAVSTPESFLQTGYVLDDRGCIVSTREPAPEHGPLFVLVRAGMRRVFAVHASIADAKDELGELVRGEPSVRHPQCEPVYGDRYRAIVSRHLGDVATRSYGGPAYRFPDTLPLPADTVRIEDERELARHFHGWVPGEIAGGRAPVLAIVQDGAPVSVCFCARRGDVACEAGLETAAAFRGRGYAARVTAAWALAVRAEGRTPLYSTGWANAASLSVARKLGLAFYAAYWNVVKAD